MILFQELDVELTTVDVLTSALTQTRQPSVVVGLDTSWTVIGRAAVVSFNDQFVHE